MDQYHNISLVSDFFKIILSFFFDTPTFCRFFYILSFRPSSLVSAFSPVFHDLSVTFTLALSFNTCFKFVFVQENRKTIESRLAQPNGALLWKKQLLLKTLDQELGLSNTGLEIKDQKFLTSRIWYVALYEYKPRQWEKLKDEQQKHLKCTAVGCCL